jgi:PAS domain S-box-containing protein
MKLRTKTILGVALIEVVLLAILVVGGIRWLQDSNEQQLIKRAEHTAHLFVSAIRDAVLSYDIARIYDISWDTLADKDINYVKVFDESGNLLATAAADNSFSSREFIEDNDPSKVTDGIFDISYDILEQGRLYGRVELGYTVGEFHQLLADARKFGWSMAALEIVLVAIFSFAFGTYLTTQLYTLIEGAQRIAEHGPGIKLPLKGNDELTKVTVAFNSMSENLASSYRELHSRTEQYRELSARLAENNAMKSAMLSTALDAIITIDQSGNVVEFNKAAEQTFGYSYDEARGRDMAEMIIPEAYREVHRQGMKHWKATGEGPVLGSRIEIVAQHKDGHIFPIELSITPIEIENETYFTGFIRDIKERKQAEEELRLAASALESHEAIFITDNEARILRANNAFTEITGFSSEEAIGSTPSNLLKSGMHEEEFYLQMWQRLNDSGHWEGEIYNKRKNGEIFPEWLSITAVKDENGEASHYVAHFIDISERKQFEQDIKLAQENAERANQAKSQFLANMSHEIRTPLNAVINLYELLLGTKLDEQQQELVRGAYEGGKALSTLLNDILDFSKIEAGKIELQEQQFALSGMINGIIDMFRPQSKAKGIELNVTVDSKTPDIVIGDEQRIRQVLVNLIGNAVKFTDRGKVSLLVEPAGNNKITFRVEDTGIGIPKDANDYLFEEFRQVDASLTRKYGGSGLGLTISKKLVHAMNGEIGCEQGEQRGSVFCFQLPLAHGVESNVIEKYEPSTEIQKSRVLVVEDSTANQIVIRTLLEKLGCIVVLANNGLEAVQSVMNDRYDLVFMDISMPVMDGYEATGKIRALQSSSSRVPIIALTANVFSEDQQRCLDSGMDDFLAKPLDAVHLREKLRQWIGATHPVQAASPASNDTSEIIDQATLDTLSEETSAELMPELMSIYIDETSNRLQELQAAVNSSGTEQVISVAHAIKSSSGTFGALKLQEAARHVETSGREGNESLMREGVPDLLNVGTETLRAMKVKADEYAASLSNTGSSLA